MRPPINSNKHYVQHSLTTVASGAATANLICQGVNAPTSATQVREGAVVKAVYVEMWAKSSTENVGNVLMTIVKTTDLQTPTFTDMTALDAYTNKKNVLYHTQGLVNDGNADAIPFIRSYYKIPKGKQRIGLGDSLFVVISAQTVGVNFCGFMTYKEYY